MALNVYKPSVNLKLQTIFLLAKLFISKTNILFYGVHMMVNSNITRLFLANLIENFSVLNNIKNTLLYIFYSKLINNLSAEGFIIFYF